MIYYDAQIVPDSSSESPCLLAAVFGHVMVLFVVFFFFLNQLGPRTALRHRFCEKQMG